MRNKLLIALLAVLGFASVSFAQVSTLPIGYTPEHRALGVWNAVSYGTWQARIVSGNSATGSSTMIVTTPGPVADQYTPPLAAVFSVNAPLLISDGSSETVTPTAVSIGTCPVGTPGPIGSQCATITASFVSLHGQSAVIVSGSYGLQDAINDAFLSGGGNVAIDSAWQALGGTAAILTAAVPYPNVGIVDYRSGAPNFWNPQASVATFLAAPTTLVAGTASSGTAACTPSGSCFAGGTIHVCIAYVDIMGNEGPCSGDYSFADTSAKAINFAAPAASTGAVGWIPYVGIEAGSASNEYGAPLVTQPTVIGVYPVSNGVCTLTTIETATPACAVTNATYNQTGSAAVVAAYPVVTEQQAFQLGGVSSTSYYAPNTIAHTAYSYVPGAHPGTAGLTTQSGPATVSAALASTVPFVLGSVAIPPGFMNYKGREIQICGFVTDAAAEVDTISAIQFWWDANGSNVTTGIPVLLAKDQLTQTLTAAANRNFCQTFVTTVASASATGGTIQAPLGWMSESQTAAGTINAMATNNTAAAVGSLNLAESARIDIVFVETTSTVDTPKLQNLTVTVIN